MQKPLWMWVAFYLIIVFLLAIDLGLFSRKNTELSASKSLKLSGFYVAISLLFGVWVSYALGPESGKEFITGYIVEKTLALDNIFVISLIFSFFSIPLQHQHRVLFWGILGVILLRGIMIGIGTALVSNFSWVLYLFAIFLMATGIKMLLYKDAELSIENNPILKWMRRHLRITEKLYGEKFLVTLRSSEGEKKMYCTPLLISLVMIEFVDIIFAVDSIPAIFAITTDTYIVYTSNIFAILGLRALYTALAAIIHRFTYLKTALALVLVFIGSKIFIADFFHLEKFPAGVSLAVTLLLLSGGIILSLCCSDRK